MTVPASTKDPNDGGHPGLPRWVKVSAIIVAVALILAVAVALISGGDYGPDRHGPGRHGLDRHGAAPAPGRAITG